MKRLVLLVLLLTACEAAPQLPERTDTCWRTGRAMMRSPSTASLVSHVENGATVYVTVDAANAYGTPVRSTIQCVFDAAAPLKIIRASVDGEPVEPAALAAAHMTAITEKIAEDRRR